MVPILRKCDREQLPAYPEAGSEENVSFYQRSGFEVMRDIELPKGPTIFQMVREPDLTGFDQHALVMRDL